MYDPTTCGQNTGVHSEVRAGYGRCPVREQEGNRLSHFFGSDNTAQCAQTTGWDWIALSEFNGCEHPRYTDETWRD